MNDRNVLGVVELVDGDEGLARVINVLQAEFGHHQG